MTGEQNRENRNTRKSDFFRDIKTYLDALKLDALF